MYGIRSGESDKVIQCLLGDANLLKIEYIFRVGWVLESVLCLSFSVRGKVTVA